MTPVMVCPQCNGSLDDSQNCPKCGTGLLYAATPSESELRKTSRDAAEKWHQSSEGRIVIGVLLALGLCYGLLQMGMACLRGLGKEAASGELNSILGLALFHSLHAVALLPAGIVAGAGQKRGALLGAAVGLFSGLFFISGMLSGVLTTLVQSFSEELLKPGGLIHELTLLSLPILHTVLGAVGGLIGGAIWKPFPDITLPLLSPQEQLAIRREAGAAKPMLRWSGPIAWGHILIGTIVATIGAVNTPTIIDMILAASNDKLRIMNSLEDRIAYAEIFSLSILLGGCIAGANSFNGLKQGVCVGITLAFLLAGIFIKDGQAPSVIYPVLCALFLAPIGGWFGSELLPPAIRFRKKRKADWP